MIHHDSKLKIILKLIFFSNKKLYLYIHYFSTWITNSTYSHIKTKRVYRYMLYTRYMKHRHLLTHRNRTVEHTSLLTHPSVSYKEYARRELRRAITHTLKEYELRIMLFSNCFKIVDRKPKRPILDVVKCETKLPLSGAVEQKNSMQTMASKKERSDHMFINLGFASADHYMWSETFLILLPLCRNILKSNPKPLWN